jgi:Tol biopolymer transport system component
MDSLLRQVAALADDVAAPDVAALRRAGDRRRRRARASAVAAVAAGVVAVLVASAVITGQGRDSAVPPPPVSPIELQGSVLVPDANGNLVAIGAAGRTRTVVAAPGGDAITDVAVDPSGARVLVVPADVAPSEPQPEVWLWLARADGSHEHRLARCPGSCSAAYQPTYAWSPDGDRLLVANPKGLFVVSVPGGGTRALDVGPGTVSGAAWSPDGTRIAAGVGSEVRSVAADGTDVRTLATGLEPGRVAWSPDGTRLAVSGASDGVWVVAADRPARTVQVAEQLQGEGPAVASWSPDSSRLAYFTTPRDGSRGFVPEVHTVAPDGTDDRRLYRGPCCVSGWGAPAWSPDGRSIALMVDTDNPSTGVHGLVIVDVATGRSSVLPVRYTRGDPVWNPGR